MSIWWVTLRNPEYASLHFVQVEAADADEAAELALERTLVVEVDGDESAWDELVGVVADGEPLAGALAAEPPR